MPRKTPKATESVAYFDELRRLAVPARLRARLKSFLRRRHPGDQKRIYHGLAHTYEVASLTARMLHSWPRVPVERKVLIALAAALHDVDPKRAKNTPARVHATLDHLNKDREARALVADFGARFGFTPEQVGALIMSTDYSAHPEEMAHKRSAFERACRRSFGADPWVAQWGKRLAYWDQISTYLHTRELARSRVAGLGRELRAAGPGFRPEKGLKGLSLRFLTSLRRNPLFEYLPKGDRRRFERILADLKA